MIFEEKTNNFKTEDDFFTIVDTPLLRKTSHREESKKDIKEDKDHQAKTSSPVTADMVGPYRLTKTLGEGSYGKVKRK